VQRRRHHGNATRTTELPRASLVDQSVGIDLAANLYFGIGCMIFVTFVIAQITTRIIEPRLGKWDRGEADENELAKEEGPEIDAAAEASGLR